MASPIKVAIVAALEREVRPLVKDWRVAEHEHSGKRFKFFEADDRVVICGGIGPEAARRATEAVIAIYHPAVVQSVGFAGALDPALKIGEVFCPSRVIDFADGSSVETGTGSGILVSFGAIASSDQKAWLAHAYGAHAVDMEAAAVARGALARGVPFIAIKAISDESSFSIPALQRFIGADGQFRSTAFVTFAAARPWLWPRVLRLARNSAKASHALCQELGRVGRQNGRVQATPELNSTLKV